MKEHIILIIIIMIINKPFKKKNSMIYTNIQREKA